MKVGWAIFLSLLVGFLVWLYMEYCTPDETVTIKNRKHYDIVTFKLPNSVDTDVFGSKFWEARHKLAELTPCSICRTEAISHEIFFHDLVNLKTGKKVMYPENFDKWVKKICNADEKKI